MYANQKILAVIPARGGSKSIPKKNIYPLDGKPMIAYTIEQTLGVPELDLTVVSTDDDLIAEIAAQFRSTVIRRPSAIAGDDASTELALIDALEQAKENGWGEFDVIVVLEPTSPLREPATISRCIRSLIDNDSPSLLTVTETRKNYGRIVDGNFSPLVPNQPRRRQEREPIFEESSTVYVCRVSHLLKTGWLMAENWRAEIIDEREVIDINEASDLVVAESYLKEKRKNYEKSN